MDIIADPKDKEIARLKELLGLSEQFRDHYRKGKLELYAMGGAVAEAAMSHLPCSEGPLERAVRKEIHSNCESKRYCEKLKSQIEIMNARIETDRIAWERDDKARGMLVALTFRMLQTIEDKDVLAEARNALRAAEWLEPLKPEGV